MKDNWDDMPAWLQTMILTYDQIRQFEETQELKILASVPRL